MPKGISLHIGLNQVDPNHYEGLWELSGCEADARLMQKLAERQGFESRRLVDEAATREAVKASIFNAAQQLEAGDMFLLTYAGHGGQVQDTAPDSDEADAYDETWCLFDAQLLDDELLLLWSEFSAGVRILVVSDSCHSGSVSTCVFEKFQRGEADADYYKYRYMPRSLDLAVFDRQRDFYEQIRHDIGDRQVEVKATVALMAACQDDEFAQEWDGHGLFSRALIDTWSEGQFEGNYADLLRTTRQMIEDRVDAQHPVFSVLGPDDVGFAGQMPFVI